MCYMNWEVLLAMCIWDFTCVGNCSECVSCQTLKPFQLEIERRKIVTTSGISKMPNIYIQSVKSILPTHELSTSNGQKDYEPNGPQSVVHWKENLQSSPLIILFPKSISLNHTAYTELAFQMDRLLVSEHQAQVKIL